jgi:hypothetical protein
LRTLWRCGGEVLGGGRGSRASLGGGRRAAIRWRWRRRRAVVARRRRCVWGAPGSDTGSNASLNAEYVKIKNTGSRAKALTSWRLHDQSHHRYTFGTFTLCGGCHVNIHTGHGTNTAKNRYWGSGAYIWNNAGDKATLVKPSGNIRDTCNWGPSPPGFKRC